MSINNEIEELDECEDCGVVTGDVCDQNELFDGVPLCSECCEIRFQRGIRRWGRVPQEWIIEY